MLRHSKGLSFVIDIQQKMEQQSARLHHIFILLPLIFYKCKAKFAFAVVVFLKMTKRMYELMHHHDVKLKVNLLYKMPLIFQGPVVICFYYKDKSFRNSSLACCVVPFVPISVNGNSPSPIYVKRPI